MAQHKNNLKALGLAGNVRGFVHLEHQTTDFFIPPPTNTQTGMRGYINTCTCLGGQASV